MTILEIWAPKAQRVRVRVFHANHLDDPALPDYTDTELSAAAGGWFIDDVSDVEHGVDYGILLDDGDKVLPDPRVALAARRRSWA